MEKPKPWGAFFNAVKGVFFASWERESATYDLDAVTDSRQRWLLAVSAPVVENMLQPGYPDVLGIFPNIPKQERKLNFAAKYHVELEADFYNFDSRWKTVFGGALTEELDISFWHQFPKDRRRDAAKLAHKDESEEDAAELWDYLNRSKIDHTGSDFRLQLLLRMMYVLRLRYRLGYCNEGECWRGLELLGRALERRLGGVTSWHDFAQRLLVSVSIAEIEDDPSDWREAVETLLREKDSIWNKVPFDSGLKMLPCRKERVFSNEPAPNYSGGAPEERRLVKSLLQKGKLVEAVNKIGEFTDNLADDAKLSRMLGLVKLKNTDPGQMKDLPDKCDNQTVALMVRGHWYVNWALAAEGTEFNVSYDDGPDLYEEGMLWAWKDVERMRAEDVDSPRLIGLSLNIVRNLHEELCGFDTEKEAALLMEDLRARFPGYYPAMSEWFFYNGPNWMVEFDEAFENAKKAADLAPEGSMLPLVLFEIAIEELDTFLPDDYDDDDDDESLNEDELEKAKEKFLQRKDVKQTLRSWVEPLLASMTPQTEYEILSTLSFWYYESKDGECLELISDAMPERVLYDGCEWDEEYKRDMVVAALTWLYHR